MPKALSWGKTPDKGRRTGKYWLRGTLVNFEVKRQVILTLMVPPEFDQALLGISCHGEESLSLFTRRKFAGSVPA